MSSSKPLHGILGVYLPLSALILWANLFGAIIGRVVPARPPFYPFDIRLWCLAGFLSTLGASFFMGTIKKSRPRRIASDFRGSVAAAVLAYILASLSGRDTAGAERFLPSVDSAAASLFAVFCWFSVVSVRDVFAGLEIFDNLKRRYRGEQLKEAMRELAPEMARTDRELKTLMKSYGTQFILPGLLLGASVFSRRTPFVLILVFLIVAAGFFILGFLGLIRRELGFASEGISLDIRDRAMPVPLMALGTGSAAIIALGVSSNQSLLPPEIIFDFLGRLGKLFASLFRPKAGADFSLPKQLFKPAAGEQLSRFFPGAEESVPWPGWKWIKYGFVALLALLFLLFMIHPLLKRSGFSLGPLKIRAALIRWFGALRKDLRAFFGALRERDSSRKLKKPDAEKIRRIAAELLSGVIKKKEVRRSVNLFARLIVWGVDTAGVPWKSSHTPGEYCGLLAAALADSGDNAASPARLRESVIHSGELFEKALYSARSLSAAGEKEFRFLVEGIVGVNPAVKDPDNKTIPPERPESL